MENNAEFRYYIISDDANYTSLYPLFLFFSAITMHFNIIPPFQPRSSKFYVSFAFCHQNIIKVI